ncbi:hypothetical protein T4D_4038 [Trichinella pseudospiralis]|uniref:Uncharacterized protein n=1 Tax=Trichinella pseudospiralis TaxID=6337 RepID=A0A0V1FTK8_TRIPS|nr:hypothetical protein T4D_7131 [Trichinella pseudospiralis]KRY89370.1 hypothetical protein T4D_4038 [Trichinella pseudospiralis]
MGASQICDQHHEKNRLENGANGQLEPKKRRPTIIQVRCCSSDKVMADSLTKPVYKQQTESFAKHMGLDGYGQENENKCWRKAIF